jgi:hypothetical protein
MVCGTIRRAVMAWPMPALALAWPITIGTIDRFECGERQVRPAFTDVSAIRATAPRQGTPLFCKKHRRRFNKLSTREIDKHTDHPPNIIRQWHEFRCVPGKIARHGAVERYGNVTSKWTTLAQIIKAVS